MVPSRDVKGLTDIMAALRTPKTGCAWDLAQTHRSLAPYALEEAYEVVDAIERDDLAELKHELGDLLLQVVFHARIAEEEGAFDFGDVVDAITSKMLRRHPQVFEETKSSNPLSGVDIVWNAMRARAKGVDESEDVRPDALGALARAQTDGEKTQLSNKLWEKIKAEEREAGPIPSSGLLSDVTRALPALARAVKLQGRASTVGFDWNEASLVLTKVREEVDELETALKTDRAEAVASEIGDLLFAVANLARHAHVDPEAAVRTTNAKFERRFGFIEQQLTERGSSLQEATLEEMEGLWRDAKSSGL